MATNSVNHRWSIAAGMMRVECNQGHAEVIADSQTVPNCEAIYPGGTNCGLARAKMSRLYGTAVTSPSRFACARGHYAQMADNASAGTCTEKICNRTRVVVMRGPYVYDPANAGQKAEIQVVVTWP